jgi:DNA (cytosine-5)-methyltransferase 1
MTLRYLDICSGISAPTMAWKSLGWTALCFAEIEAAPRAVLSHHYPDVPLCGDFTQIRGDEYGSVDLLVGGTPCQSFSVAGLRGGLADARGNLALEFLRLADRARPRWIVWENVPGVFSSLSHDAPDFSPPDIDLDAGDGPEDGEEVVVEDCYDADENHAFACVLAGFSELGYGWAYRVFDAQFAGVPQRRRRVFVVGHLGDWRRAAAVLFERHSLSGHPAPRREARERTADRSARSVAIRGREGVPQAELGDEIANAILTPNGGRGGVGVGAILEASTGEISHCLNAGGMGRQDYETETLIAHSLRAEGFDASEDGTGRGTPLIVADTLTSNGDAHSGFRDERGLVAFSITPSNSNKDYNAREVQKAQALTAGGNRPSARGGDIIALDLRNALRDPEKLDSMNRQGCGIGDDLSHTLSAGAEHGVSYGSAVRRLTPRECERLQGFPDNFTLVPHRGKPMADGPRYKMLGNSMAVPVVRWIGERIEAVEALMLDAMEAA